MASLLRYLLLLGGLCKALGVDSVNTKDECKYGAVNGSVTFLVSSLSPPDSILWTKAKNKVIEWDSRDKSKKDFPPFEGRVNLNTTSGDLTIFNLSKADAGEYIYDDMKLKFCLEVYEPLPSPKINQTSSDGRNIFQCVIPGYQDHSGNVMFSWNCSSPVCANRSESEIYFEKTDSLPEEITCTVQNKISKENATITTTSQSQSTAWWIILISILIPVLVFAVIIVLFICFVVPLIRKKYIAPETVKLQVLYTRADTQDTPVPAETQDKPVSAETQDKPVSAENQDKPVSAENQDTLVS